MATKKSGGSSKNGRDSVSKRLGIKVYGNQQVNSGSIIVRQRGSQILPGVNTKLGRDYTLYSTSSGSVYFHKNKNRTYVSVL